MKRDPSSLEVARLIEAGHRRIASWEDEWPSFETDSTLAVENKQVERVFDELTARLRDNYPFFHPHYAGQMLKPGHPVAAAAYAIAQRINPNNHALDGGPATARMEEECIAALASMFGYDPLTSLGHLTSSGTIANLEALWVSRQSHPGKAIAFSEHAHYTHARMCEVLGVEGLKIPTDCYGRIDLSQLETALRGGGVGTVVATTGTTGIGAVDRVDLIYSLCQQFGTRLHVDAAYGGFYSVLTGESGDNPGQLSSDTASAFRAIALADSVVIDPHKHGLQPYGCGAVIFRDAAVGRFYKHDSPYTYFTSLEQHLGEISLECSRSGAAAAALWATLQCFPLAAGSGFGPFLKKCRAAAQNWATTISAAEDLTLLVQPDLDIVAFYPRPGRSAGTVSSVSSASQRIFETLMSDAQNPYYLALLNVGPDLATSPDLTWDTGTMTILRSVLMKPEHLELVPALHAAVLAALSVE